MRHVSRHRCRLINSYGKPQERSVPENLELELHKQFSASREKYIYFLLAASATAIGYAMAQSKIEPLDWVHIPLGISIFLWGTSFISGIRFIEYSISSTFQNQNYLAFKREVKSSRVSNPSELIVDFKIKLQTTLKIGIYMLARYPYVGSKCIISGSNRSLRSLGRAKARPLTKR